MFSAAAELLQKTIMSAEKPCDVEVLEQVQEEMENTEVEKVTEEQELKVDVEEEEHQNDEMVTEEANDEVAQKENTEAGNEDAEKMSVDDALAEAQAAISATKPEETKAGEAEVTAPKPRSIFMGNVSFSTKQDSLGEYCKKFGEIESCMLMRDNKRIQSGDANAHRGFGFVNFKTQEGYDNFFKATHEVDGRTLNIKESKPKTQKVFIAPIDRSKTNEETIKKHFSQYGEILDIFHNVSRGFAFITLVDTGSNLKALLKQTHETIDGYEVECKLAKPRRKDDQFGGQRGGRGRGRGGYGGMMGNPWGMAMMGNPWGMGGMGMGGMGMGGMGMQAKQYNPYPSMHRGGRGGRGSRGGRRGRGRARW